MVTRPERIGGILYGYAPYLKMFKVQDQTSSFLSGSAYGIIELLVSPYGRLAECKLFVKAKVWQDDKIVETVIDTYNLDTELLSEDDKIFMPATVNHQNTSVTIYLICNIKANGLLSLY
jgi:hypothetical protein